MLWTYYWKEVKMLFIFAALAISQLDGIALETKMVNSTGSGIPRVDPTKTDPFFLKVTACSQSILPPHAVEAFAFFALRKLWQQGAGRGTGESRRRIIGPPHSPRRSM
jgi:hypothetical protein